MAATPKAIKASAIQAPTKDLSNAATILRQVKESIEVAQRLRGDQGDSYVRVSELVALGYVQLVNGTLQPGTGLTGTGGGGGTVAPVPGFGTPVNNAVVANYDGNTATMADTTATVAEILAILMANGLIST